MAFYYLTLLENVATAARVLEFTIDNYNVEGVYAMAARKHLTECIKALDAATGPGFDVLAASQEVWDKAGEP